MTTQEQFIKLFGKPWEDQAGFEKKHMTVLVYPEDIAKNIPALGKSIYINKVAVEPYLKWLRLIVSRGLHKEIKENDQCFCVRKIRGTTDSWSSHTWAMAVDHNPKDNPLGETRLQSIAAGRNPFSEQFQQCARDAGWIAGIDFKRKDGMHFEYHPWLVKP